ncbi:MAG: hypothetical protein ACOYVK_21700 [Bacillota bacterium]
MVKRNIKEKWVLRIIIVITILFGIYYIGIIHSAYITEIEKIPKNTSFFFQINVKNQPMICSEKIYNNIKKGNKYVIIYKYHRLFPKLVFVKQIEAYKE